MEKCKNIINGIKGTREWSENLGKDKNVNEREKCLKMS